MTKEAIISKLETDHQQFISYIASMEEKNFMYAPREKWSAGQHADHIRRSVAPLKVILALPKMAVKFLFKKSNRPSRSYDALVEKYGLKLQGGGKASGRFVPGPVTENEKDLILKKISRDVSGICRSLRKYSEKELDLYTIPHPLLGRLTIREMMYFTIHHVEHHHNMIIRYLLEVSMASRSKSI
jgi:hypothetical protein